MSAFVYMLRCVDGSFYVGSTRTDLERRIAEHQQGAFPDNYTFMRRPVELVWSEHFPIITDAIATERKIKGWSRAKKEALVSGDWESVRRLAKRSGAQGDE
jgi:putative endonuclease